MIICILVDDEHVDAVREKASELIGTPKGAILTIPVSSTGELPATHWFCHFEVSQAMHDKLMAAREFSDMKVGNPKAFLKDRELKRIRK